MMTSNPKATTAEKQGIVVAILGSTGGGGSRPGCAAAGSLRRTLSADMSSKKWLAQNGLCAYTSPMKKIASSKDFSLNPILDSPSSSEDEEEEENCFRAWNNNDVLNKEQVEIKKEFDIWSSIISQNASNDAESSKSLPPPYIHPLVKRSASSLSEKSLQICTESLGCETGSDGFSASSEASDSESECCHKEEAEPREAVKFGYSPARRPVAAARTTTALPPPLPSLSSRGGGDGAPRLRMRSRRDNGRLVVEAVAVPASQKNFAAQRRDGRLVLMFASETSGGITGHKEEKEERGETEELEEQFGEEESEEMEIEIEDEEEEEVVDREEVMSKIEIVTEKRLINFHRLALMADKRRNNPAMAWSKGGEDDEEKEPVAVAASLPPRPPVGRLIPAPAVARVSTAAAASFNHYEYFWRSKITAGPLNDSKLEENDKRQLVVLRGNRGNSYLVSSLKGCCKEPRRTLTWEPRCIATS